MHAPPPDTSRAANLRWILIIRAIALVGQAATVWFVVARLDRELPLNPLASILVGIGGLTALSALRLCIRVPVRDPELVAQLSMDVAALTGLLYYSGGATNPFAPLYLLPLTLTAAALPGAYTWVMAALTIACYTALLFFYVPLPSMHGGHDGDFELHVLGMWLGFVLSALLISGFAARMAATLRSRDRLAAEMRERALKQERVLALGALAAGAAHELGTPLSTLAVLLKDIEPGRPMAIDTLAILRAQIVRCKEILQSLAASAGAARAESGARLSLDAWLEDVLHRWQVMRPGVRVRARFEGSQPAPHLVAEQTLSQAITSLLNNAADASPDSVEIEGRWDTERLILKVADRGPGLAPGVEAAVGEAFITTKTAGQGLGLGLFLAHTTLARFGGDVRLLSREGGGTLCRLELPLATLKVSS